MIVYKRYDILMLKFYNYYTIPSSTLVYKLADIVTDIMDFVVSK